MNVGGGSGYLMVGAPELKPALYFVLRCNLILQRFFIERHYISFEKIL